ncbi:hypothetical protein L465_00336 [Enterobacter sp. BIDMC 29]|nr:hypothetical protein L465_00336 [Enterobacter sp. BIDMC 29]
MEVKIRYDGEKHLPGRECFPVGESESAKFRLSGESLRNLHRRVIVRLWLAISAFKGAQMYHIQYALPFRLRENSFAATRRRFSQTAETLVVVKTTIKHDYHQTARRECQPETRGDAAASCRIKKGAVADALMASTRTCGVSSFSGDSGHYPDAVFTECMRLADQSERTIHCLPGQATIRPR